MPITWPEAPLPGIVVLEPKLFHDDRGYFTELATQRLLIAHGIQDAFVQDNLSYSSKGVLRGLHFQAPPFAQAKLVTVITGYVLDIAVDIRKSSPTYGQTYCVELDDKTHRMVYLPAGFAHGFVVLSDSCHFLYKCSAYYDKASEMGLRWDDPALGIDWQVAEPVLSSRDLEHPLLKDLLSPFE
jgi:dTDP-4-dehydrorhamnose 3,5-epimerase